MAAMSVTLTEFDTHLRTLLDPDRFTDYAPNGLQIEAGGPNIRKVAFAVSANRTAIMRAWEQGADTLVVHHGFGFRNEPRTFTGFRAARLAALFEARMHLFAYHLPLDAHPQVGNSAGLLRSVGAEVTDETFGGVGRIGTFGGPVDRDVLLDRLADRCGPARALFLHGPEVVHRVAVLTGGGAGYFEEALETGADLFVTGEPSEMAQGIAAETGASFAAFGHHATERFGPQALAAQVAAALDVDTFFVDVDNPV